MCCDGELGCYGLSVQLSLLRGMRLQNGRDAAEVTMLADYCPCFGFVLEELFLQSTVTIE